MNDQTTQIDDLHLLAEPSAVNCTELFLRFTLAEWHLQPLADEAVDAATRIVRKAVEAYSDQRGIVVVRLRLRGAELVLEVEEQHGETPGDASFSDAALATRSQNTGVEALDGGGYRYWCALALPDGAHACSVALPRRGTTRSTVRRGASNGSETETDPEVLQRVLAALNTSSAEQTE